MIIIVIIMNTYPDFVLSLRETKHVNVKKKRPKENPESVFTNAILYVGEKKTLY